MSNVEERVKKIVAEQLGVKEDIANDASFVDDLGADSLDTVELVMALEEGFGIEIPDEDAERRRRKQGDSQSAASSQEKRGRHGDGYVQRRQEGLRAAGEVNRECDGQHVADEDEADRRQGVSSARREEDARPRQQEAEYAACRRRQKPWAGRGEDEADHADGDEDGCQERPEGKDISGVVEQIGARACPRRPCAGVGRFHGGIG